MIMRKSNKKDGEPLTLDGLMSELNNLFGSRKDDPAAKDIRSMIQSLVNGEACFEEKAEDDAMTACPDGLDPEGVDISNEDLSGGMIGYNSITDASKADGNIMTQDINCVDMPIIAFIAPNHMMEGVVETIRSMTRPTIVAKEYVGGVVNVIKASIACGKKCEKLIEKHGSINALVFDEKSGMCRLSINRKDGYDFIFGENGVTRFIIFDELSCPDTIPTDIVQDDRKWGKRMTSELPKLIEKRIEESKSEEDTNPDCFRCIVEYMAKEGVDNIYFWTDMEGLIHCDVQVKTIYKVELDDSDKK